MSLSRHFVHSFLSISAALLFGACASTAVSDAGADTNRNDTSFTCPSDPATLIGQPCSVNGQQCGSCAGVCSFCNYALCDGTHWTNVEVGPGLCDAGTDAAGVTCGTQTCAPGQICIHTQAGGGPCRIPDDGGVCPDGSTLSGGCCIYHSEWYACAARPASCDPTLSCGCATTLCNGNDAGIPACQCTGANGSQVECGCFYP